MPQFRVVEIAAVLGVSDDTVRRWVDAGELDGAHNASGRLVVDGVSAARMARDRARPVADPCPVARSARNRFVGLVTTVDRDTVMARVTMLCGRVEIEALVSAEAVDELALEPGSLVVAVVKATQVLVERVDQHPGSRPQPFRWSALA